MSVLVDALLGSSVSGSSLPRVTRSDWTSARFASALGEAEGVSEAGADAAGVEAAGEALLVAPPQAVTIITPAASRPSSRLCINCPPNGWIPESLPQTRPFPCLFASPPGRSRS